MLVDQYGRPVKLSEVAREQARPSLTGIRQAWAPSIASGLTPAGLAGVLRAAAEGDIHDYLALAEEMEERDAHYASVLGTRKRVVSGVAPVVEPASEDARDVAIADAVREEIAEHPDFACLVEDLMDGVAKGFSVVEIDWTRTATRWRPRAFVHRDPRHFTFDRETGRELRLIDEADPEGLPLTPFRFLAHLPRIKSGLPLRGGLARLVAFGWICKAYDVKDWIAFVETYGLPLRLGRYGPEATPADVRVLHTAVANIGADAAAVLPESMRIEFQQLSDGAGADIFDSLARWVDEQTSKAVLGQTMTADNGSSMAQAGVHNEVRHDIAASDARQLTATIARDLVRPYVDLNFGQVGRYPRLSIVVPEPEDIELMIRGVAALAPLGVRFRAAELRAKMGLGDPDEDDEDVIGGAPAAPVATARDIRAASRAMAEARLAEADIYRSIDAIEATAALEWERQLAPMIEPILRLAAETGSFEAFRARLPELLGEMEIGPLVDGLVAALFQARGEGDLSDGV